jgi:hypothetical protein
MGMKKSSPSEGWKRYLSIFPDSVEVADVDVADDLVMIDHIDDDGEDDVASSVRLS